MGVDLLALLVMMAMISHQQSLQTQHCVLIPRGMINVRTLCCVLAQEPGNEDILKEVMSWMGKRL